MIIFFVLIPFIYSIEDTYMAVDGDGNCIEYWQGDELTVFQLSDRWNIEKDMAGCIGMTIKSCCIKNNYTYSNIDYDRLIEENSENQWVKKNQTIIIDRQMLVEEEDRGMVGLRRESRGDGDLEEEVVVESIEKVMSDKKSDTDGTAERVEDIGVDSAYIIGAGIIALLILIGATVLKFKLYSGFTKKREERRVELTYSDVIKRSDTRKRMLELRKRRKNGK